MAFFVSFTDTYLKDQGLTGKCKAEEGASDDNEDDKEEDDDDEEEDNDSDNDDDKMPAKMKKATPAKKPTKTAAKPKTPKAKQDSDGDDFDGLVEAFQKNLNLNAWFKIDQSQDFPIFAFVFAQLATQTRYVYIRIELVGSVQDEHVHAKLIKEGDVAEITIKIRKGGELTNPDHALVQFADTLLFEENHLLYMARQQIHHFQGEAFKEEERKIVVELPFHCNPSGFFDPIRNDQDVLDLGIFPLPNVRPPLDCNAPAPSTKFLHLMCEELSKAKVEQRMRTCSYFSPLPAADEVDPHDDLLDV